MVKREFSGIPLWQFELLNKYEDFFHFVSGRPGGASTGNFAELNLSFGVGDESENVTENRRRLAIAIGSKLNRLIFPQQTHSGNVVSVHSQITESLECTDALITREEEVCVAVMAADCVPVLLMDVKQKVVAAIHAGWRGTVSRIAENTVEKMKEDFDCDPHNIVAGIGPSVSPEVYEVGQEVAETISETFPDERSQLLMPSPRTGKYLLDLWKANSLQLTGCGLLPENIEVSGICTLQNQDDFFSARGADGATGRFSAGIMVRSI